MFCTLICALTLGGDPAYMPLFNGKDFTGWQPKATKTTDQWAIKDGILAAKAGNSWLATEKSYGDFVLKMEWKLPENGNSGVFIRVPPEADKQPWVSGMEIQILDDDGPQYKDKLKPYQFTGSIYGVVPAKKGFVKSGQWNQFEIACKGDDIVIVLNGTKITEGNMAKEPALKDRPRTGLIGLQNHGTTAEFRNVVIRELK